MNFLNNKIRVHRFFSELFGHETTVFDLLAIVTSSFSFAGIALFLSWNADISILKKVVLAMLALDVAGGVVANFTRGTNNYYADSLRKRYLFIGLHLLQPLMLIWIFPSDLIAILCVSLFTLTSSILVLNINNKDNQRVGAITLLLVCFLLSAVSNFNEPLAQMTLQLFSIKLIFAFSVIWTTTNKREIAN
jgi:hypothetical protein